MNFYKKAIFTFILIIFFFVITIRLIEPVIDRQIKSSISDKKLSEKLKKELKNSVENFTPEKREFYKDIIKKGYKTVFLGEDIPIDDLIDFKNHFDEIIFLSYLTVSPTTELVDEYVASFEELVLKDTNSQLWLLGKQVEHLQSHSKNVFKYSGIEDLLNDT